MGQGPVRQQIPTRSGSGLPQPATRPHAPSGAGSFHGPGISVTASQAQLQVEGGGSGDDKIPVVFFWNHGGQQVELAASFNKWEARIKMVRSGNEFSIVQDLPKGVHQYKFIVDDQWRINPDQPRTQDNDGNVNNVIDMSNYHRFQVSMTEEPLPRFSQHIPDPNDYTVDAPVIPAVLSKSPLCAAPMRPSLAVGQPPNVPPHSLSDHFYLNERWGEDGGCPLVAVTHRYGQKFSTTSFVTRNPTTREGASPNHLKRAVRRPQPKRAAAAA